MPPKKAENKKKASKGKQSAVVDGLSTEEMSKDQLEEHIVRLREELDREREERSYFQLERDKMQASWEICKRSLEEREAGLRVRQREKEAAKERHRVEINVHKQKLKHVLAEQHAIVSGLKVDAVTAASLIQKQNMQTEVGLRGELSGLRASDRKKQLDDENRIKELKLKQQVELMELTNDYDRRITDMAMNFHEKMLLALDKHDKEKSEEIQEVEERWKRRIATQVEHQGRAYKQADVIFSEVQEKRLLLLKHKEEQEELRKEVHREEKELAADRQENDGLQTALQESQQKLPQLQKHLEGKDKEWTQMLKCRGRVKVMEKELDELDMEQLQLEQAVQKVQQERDELKRKQTEALLDAQQQAGLKTMLLERKVEVLRSTLEKKEAQLCATLSVLNIKPTAASNAADTLKPNGGAVDPGSALMDD